MTLSTSPNGPMHLRSFSIFNPTLSRGNEERAMDNIIYYYPDSEDQNTQMNKVGFCVACACICERFAVRIDGGELIDEIQTEGSVTVLYSPLLDTWVSVEVDPCVDTLPMRLLLEKGVASFLLLYGQDSLCIEAPPHKRYIQGSDPQIEKLQETSSQRKRLISEFFSEYIAFLTNYALITTVGVGQYFDYRSRVAADALLAMPVSVSPFQATTILQLELLCSKFASYLVLDEEHIRLELTGSDLQDAATPSKTDVSRALQFVICNVDESRLIYSSTTDLLTQRLIFLVRTHLALLEKSHRHNVTPIYYSDVQGQKIVREIVYAQRSGYAIFVLKSEAGGEGTSTSGLMQRVAKRNALLADFLECVELISSASLAKACEVRAMTLHSESKQLLRKISGSSGIHIWSPAILSFSSISGLNDISAAGTLFSPSPIALMSCLADAPIGFAARNGSSKCYPVAHDPQPIPRSSDVQPSIICFNKGLAYGAPLASLPRMAQIAVAHYMSEVWRNHVPSAITNTEQDEVCVSANTIIDSINRVRFQGRSVDVTNRKCGSSGLTLPTLMVDSDKDVSDIWVPILVRNMGLSPSNVTPTPPPTDEGSFGIALLAIAQFNGRVVTIYFPPRNRQSFSEQIAHATVLFKASFKGTGFV